MGRITTTGLMIWALIVLNGCSSLRSTKRLDLAPFAEHTISLASDIEYGLTETSRAVYLREFWHDPEVVAHHLMTRIDRANEDVLAIQKAIRTGQYRVFNDLIRLGQYRQFQDAEALREMFENDPQLLEYAKVPHAPTIPELQAIEDRILLKLAKGMEFQKQIQPDIENYHQQQQQLADL